MKKKYSPANTNGTLPHFKSDRWSKINSRTINGNRSAYNKCNQNYKDKGIRLDMEKKEFYEWCDSQWETINKYYKEGEVPSIDRINNRGHYSLDNIRIISFSENRKRSTDSQKIPVKGVSIKTNETIEFNSLMDAFRATSISFQNISKCLKKERNSAGGYRWEYV